MDNLHKAIVLAIEAHAGQLDKIGLPYILHPLFVMLSVQPDNKAMQVAVLHDVLEDTPVTEVDLKHASFSDTVVEAVRLMTRPPKGSSNRPTYREYVQNVVDAEGGAGELARKLARKVK